MGAFRSTQSVRPASRRCVCQPHDTARCVLVSCPSGWLSWIDRKNFRSDLLQWSIFHYRHVEAYSLPVDHTPASP